VLLRGKCKGEGRMRYGGNDEMKWGRRRRRRRRRNI
jgi:hypothetical protein